MKKKIFITVFAAVFLLFMPKVKAASFTDKQVVPSSKIWTINFSDEVVLDDITKNDINVKDSSGNIVPVNLTFDQGNNKSVRVNPPSNGYTPGGKYTLNIGNNVHSSKGKTIKNKVEMNFSIESGSSNYKIGDMIKLPESDNEYEIEDVEQADVDGDSKKEDVILAGLPEGTMYQEVYLIIADKETGKYKAYEYVTGETLKKDKLYFNDYDGDGVSEIRFEFGDGRNHSSSVYSYKNGKIQDMGLQEKLFTCETVDKRIGKITLPFDKSSYTIDLLQDQDWMWNVKQGGFNQELYTIGNLPDYYEDEKDEDGTTILKSYMTVYGANSEDKVATVVSSYKYNKDEQKFDTVNQQIITKYPCTKIQSDYLKTEDYKNENVKLEAKIISAYTEYGQKHIQAYCYKSLTAEEAIDYEKKSGNTVDALYYDESGNPCIDDDTTDITISDVFELPVADNVEVYDFDISSMSKKAISFSDLGTILRDYSYNNFSNDNLPFGVTISNGEVTSITREYRP